MTSRFLVFFASIGIDAAAAAAASIGGGFRSPRMVPQPAIESVISKRLRSPFSLVICNFLDYQLALMLGARSPQIMVTLRGFSFIIFLFQEIKEVPKKYFDDNFSQPVHFTPA